MFVIKPITWLTQTMTHENIVCKILTNDTNCCSLCLQNILEKEYCYNLQDEIIFDNKVSSSKEIYNILSIVLGTHVIDNISSTLICQKCTENAITSYNFIEMCRNNIKKLSNVANCLLRHSENLSTEDNNTYKSVYLALDKDTYRSNIYYDNKRYKQKLHILKRFQFLQIKQYEENISNLKITETTCENSDSSCYKSKDKKINKKEKKARFIRTIPLSEILYEKPDQNKYKCKNCLKVYISSIQLRQHYFRVHAPKDFKCTKCPRSFGSSLLLNCHSKNSHCTVVCSQCGKTYSNMYSLKHHEKNHEAQLVCQTCGKVYKGKQSFNNHIEHKLCQTVRKLSVEPKFTCDYCQKKYSHKTTLSVHIRLEHENGKAFVCNWCGKKLSSDSRLKDHILKHTKQKDFQCNICGGKFVTKMSLLYHTRTHTGEKPYKCEHCSMTFLSASRRSEHTKRHHSGPELECDICLGKFKGQTGLIRHRKRHFNVSSRLYHKKPPQS